MKLLSLILLLPLASASPIGPFTNNKTAAADVNNIPFLSSHPAKPIPQPRNQADAEENEISLFVTPQTSLSPTSDIPVSVEVALDGKLGGGWIGNGDGTMRQESRWTRFRRFLGRYS